MVNKNCKSRKILFALLALLAFTPAFSEEKKNFSQHLEWKADKNAYEYKVELKSESVSTFYSTQQAFLDLQLKPGKYSYRIYVYDLLGRESSISTWTDFEILKASQPEITAKSKEPVLADGNGNISLDLDIEGINENSIVELIADPIQGKIVESNTDDSTDSETGSASKVEFSDVPEGRWRIRVTNQSGLSTESDVIEVQKKGAAKKSSKADTKEEKVAEKSEEEKKAEQDAADTAGGMDEKLTEEDSV